jgi:hypothetical protein
VIEPCPRCIPPAFRAGDSTYKWVEIKGAAHPNQLVDSQIKAAIDLQLALKRLTPIDQNPDLDVG